MERGVRAKLKAAGTCESQSVVPRQGARSELEALLLATHPHPLLSVKPDIVWGFHPGLGEGENRLAKIWMRIRDELVCDRLVQ